MRCLAWSFGAPATGQRPRVRHDGTPFTEREAFRAAHATPLPKGCLVYLQGDWSEFVHTFGLPSWNSNLHPCPCCSASANELGEVGAASVVYGPHPDETFEDYDRACADCEFMVIVNSRVDFHKLAGSQHYDQRSQGNHGRTLSVALHSLGLLVPLWVTFRRQDDETSARNPLFSLERETHTNLGLLHCVGFAPLRLGVYKKLLHDRAVEVHSCGCMETWRVDTGRSRADVGATLQGRTASAASNAKFAASVDRCLKLQDLRPSMLGNPLHQKLGTKAAVTGTLLAIARDLAKQHVACLGDEGPPLVAVGDALVRMRDVMRVKHRVMPAAALQELVDQVKRAFVLRPLAGIRGPPKLASREIHSPTTTFLDEEWRSWQAGCHRMTWHKRVLAGFRYAYSFSDHRVTRRRHEFCGLASTILLLFSLLCFRKALARTKTVKQRQ